MKQNINKFLLIKISFFAILIFAALCNLNYTFLPCFASWEQGELKEITVDDDNNETTIIISATKPIKFNTYILKNPDRFAIDLLNTSPPYGPLPKFNPTQLVPAIRIGRLASSIEATRIVIDLTKQNIDFDVDSLIPGNKLKIKFKPGEKKEVNIQKLLKKAIKLDKKKNYSEAIQVLNDALLIEPENPQIRQNLSISHNHYGESLVKNTDNEKAISEFRLALYYNFAHKVADSNLDTILINTGIKFYDPLVRAEIGDKLLSNADFKPALVEYKKALALSQNPDPITLIKIGDVYYALYSLDEQYPAIIVKAKDSYNKALQIEESASVHIQAGNRLLDVEDVNEAINHYKRAVELEPDSQEAIAAYIKGWNEAVRLVPHSAVNHIGLGKVLLLNKDFINAEKELNYALKLDPQNQSAINALEELDSLRNPPDSDLTNEELTDLEPPIETTDSNYLSMLLALMTKNNLTLFGFGVLILLLVKWVVDIFSTTTSNRKIEETLSKNDNSKISDTKNNQVNNKNTDPNPVEEIPFIILAVNKFIFSSEEFVSLSYKHLLKNILPINEKLPPLHIQEIICILMFGAYIELVKKFGTKDTCKIMDKTIEIYVDGLYNAGKIEINKSDMVIFITKRIDEYKVIFTYYGNTSNEDLIDKFYENSFGENLSSFTLRKHLSAFWTENNMFLGVLFQEYIKYNLKNINDADINKIYEAWKTKRFVLNSSTINGDLQKLRQDDGPSISSSLSDQQVKDIIEKIKSEHKENRPK